MAEPRVHAPDFSKGLVWLNTPEGASLSLRALRGQIVVLDFWTYCCVNCMHVQPVLAQIERRLAGEPLVVIGVHSAKFDGEKDAARIDEAIRRYDILHPVVVDREMETWQAFAIRSWPTLVVLRPDGTIAAVAPGEPDLDALEGMLRAELARARKLGTLAAAPFTIEAAPREVSGALAYPGKIAVGPSGLVAVADSGHHRVLVVDRDGRVQAAIGSGLAGSVDGALAESAFDDPQGIAWLSPDVLLVADARAHVIRRVDLAARTVTTVAGTGALGAAPLGEPARGNARTTPLRSPWDLLAIDDRVVLVAMAGSHQIATLDLRDGSIGKLAGTGAESIVDGAFEEATFSQPSGLARAGRVVFVADSETSAVRALDLDARTVRTVVGRGLFDFGDRDGAREVALLQHDLDVAVSPEGSLVVADTYNGKLKRVDPATGAVTTIAVGLSEPGGLAWDEARGAWLVADTTAHRVAVVDPRTGQVTPLAIEGAPRPSSGRIGGDDAPGRREDDGSTAWFTSAVVPTRGEALGAGDATIEVALHAPAGRKIAARAPVHVAIEVSRRSDLILPEATEIRGEAGGGRAERITLRARIEPFAEARIEAELVLRVDAITCDEAAGEGAVCTPYRAWLRVPLPLARDGSHHVAFDALA